MNLLFRFLLTMNASSCMIVVYAAGGDAMVTVLEGKGRFTVDGEVFFLEAGDTLIMPKDIPHAVYGEEQFKMQLVVSY